MINILPRIVLSGKLTIQECKNKKENRLFNLDSHNALPAIASQTVDVNPLITLNRSRFILINQDSQYIFKFLSFH